MVVASFYVRRAEVTATGSLSVCHCQCRPNVGDAVAE